MSCSADPLQNKNVRVYVYAGAIDAAVAANQTIHKIASETSDITLYC